MFPEPACPDGLARPVPVLLYHDINDTPLPGQEPWTVGTAAFSRHMALVARSDRTPTTMTAYAGQLVGDPATAADEKPPVLVTFDDGYASWPDAIATMAELGVRSATMYVTTGARGDTGMATWPGLAALPHWVEIGAHSVTHPQLDLLPLDAVWREVQESKRACEVGADRPCRSFAYPHGYHTARVRQQVIDAGFSSAAAVKNALSHHRDDAFAVARVTITADTTDEQVEELLRGRGAPVAWRGERLRTRGFRAYRRARAAWLRHR
ncbi:MAG TPA: polysaccharide deacetylase family protein [Dermatophilaceae bacterium]|jgi:peptidoglycan/xylan/chitin deacetylase (PgdA/CDA1 family)